MESPVVMYIVAACLVIALLVIAVKLTLSHLSELREIEAAGRTPPTPDPDPVKPRAIVEKSDLASTLLAAEKIIVVPGFGLGVSQAQLQLGELLKYLADRGKNISVAIHPAAGRVPGHMNILLDEAEVPHACIFDLDGINDHFPACDLALIIGANDVVNPAARDDRDHPSYGMAILDADKARQVVVIKRGQGNGFSGTDNPLFTRDNVRMVLGDARDTLLKLLDEVNPGHVLAAETSEKSS